MPQHCRCSEAILTTTTDTTCETKILHSIKSSGAHSHIRWIKHTSISEIKSISIIRVLICLDTQSAHLYLHTSLVLLQVTNHWGECAKSTDYHVLSGLLLNESQIFLSMGCQVQLSIKSPSLLKFMGCNHRLCSMQKHQDVCWRDCQNHRNQMQDHTSHLCLVQLQQSVTTDNIRDTEHGIKFNSTWRLSEVAGYMNHRV